MRSKSPRNQLKIENCHPKKISGFFRLRETKISFPSLKFHSVDATCPHNFLSKKLSGTGYNDELKFGVLVEYLRLVVILLLFVIRLVFMWFLLQFLLLLLLLQLL